MNESFWKTGHWPTLLNAFLYFDVSFMVWVLLGALGNHVAADLDLQPAQKGMLVALPLLGGSILRLALGYLSDQIGAKRTGTIGLALTFLPLLLGWIWADSIGKVYCVGLLLGVAGASFAVALPMASRWYPPQHQGLALGIAGAGNSGTLLSTLCAPRLAEMFGWNAVFGLAMLPLGLVTISFLMFAKDAPARPKRCSVPDFLAVLKERDIYLFSLFYGVTFGGFVGLASFLSLLLRDQYGISKIQAADFTSLCVFAGSFLRPVGGLCADKWGGIRMLSVLYGLLGILFLLVAQLPPVGAMVGLFFLIMACLGIGNGSVFQLVPQRFNNRVGVATGILGAAGGLGGFALAAALGLLKQWTGAFSTGLAACVVLALLALVVLAVAQADWIGVWIDKHGRSREAGRLAGNEQVKTA